MAFPTGWPPRPASGRRSIRFYVTDTATAVFADRAYLFSDQAAANTFIPLPYVAPGAESQVVNIGSPPIGGGQNANDSLSDPRIGPLVSPPPQPMIWACSIRVVATNGVDLEVSFDGTNVQGRVNANSSVIFRERYEAGIAVRGNGGIFIIEAW